MVVSPLRLLHLRLLRLLVHHVLANPVTPVGVAVLHVVVSVVVEVLRLLLYLLLLRLWRWLEVVEVGVARAVV